MHICIQLRLLGRDSFFVFVGVGLSLRLRGGTNVIVSFGGVLRRRSRFWNGSGIGLVIGVSGWNSLSIL